MCDNHDQDEMASETSSGGSGCFDTDHAEGDAIDDGTPETQHSFAAEKPVDHLEDLHKALLSHCDSLDVDQGRDALSSPSGVRTQTKHSVFPGDDSGTPCEKPVDGLAFLDLAGTDNKRRSEPAPALMTEGQGKQGKRHKAVARLRSSKDRCVEWLSRAKSPSRGRG